MVEILNNYLKRMIENTERQLKLLKNIELETSFSQGYFEGCLESYKDIFELIKEIEIIEREEN